MDRPLRALQPAGSVERPLETAPVPSQLGRRKHIGVACNACRKRKSRCDGNRPTCQLCIQKRTECVYHPARRKSVDLQAQNTQLEEDLRVTLGLYEHLQRCPSPEAQSIFTNIRRGEDIFTLAERVNLFRSVGPADAQSLASASEDLMADSTMLIPETAIGAQSKMDMDMQHHVDQASFQNSAAGHSLAWMHGNPSLGDMSALSGNPAYNLYNFDISNLATSQGGSNAFPNSGNQRTVSTKSDDELDAAGDHDMDEHG